MNWLQLKEFLDEKVAQYNQISFIENDPISVPHKFSLKQDIEISGLFASVFAWGNRKIIINKTTELMDMMGNSPYAFILEHSNQDLLGLRHFKHRTFNTTDLYYFIEFLNDFYGKHESLEEAFIPPTKSKDRVKDGLINFRNLFFSLPEAPERTKKHISTPLNNSACKRLNMYLRWMVRKDETGVDFGIWNRLKPSELYCPEDLHVGRVARKLGLINQLKSDWETTVHLTNQLRKLDKEDPVKYDFALFGLGVMEGFAKE